MIGLNKKTVHKRTQSGFTIIEVMISLTIFTAILSLLFSGLHQTINNWDKAGQYVSQNQQQLARHNWLERLFAQTLASDFPSKISGHQPYLDGDKQQMKFISTAPILDMPETTKPVSLKFEQQNDQIVLMYGEGQKGDDPQRGIDWNKLTWIPLIGELKSGNFKYEAPTNPKPEDESGAFMMETRQLIYRDKPEWFEQYSAAAFHNLPQRVSIQFIDKDENRHQWFFRIYHHANVWSLEYYE